MNTSIIRIMIVTAVFSLDGSPDFEKIADAYGLDYFHLEHNDEMEQRIDEFLACEHAAMMVCEVYSFDLVKE